MSKALPWSTGDWTRIASFSASRGATEKILKKSLEFNLQEERHLQSLPPWVKHAQIGGGRQYHTSPSSKQSKNEIRPTRPT